MYNLDLMKALQEWRADLAGASNPALERVEGRGGCVTLKAGSIFLHSRYDPDQEAQRLIESAALDASRPVLVIGSGLGYHVLGLLKRGIETAVVEPDPAVLRAALEGPLSEANILAAVGEPEAFSGSEAFESLALRMPQIVVHPPTARLHPGYAEAVQAAVSKAAFAGRHLNIAVVGPLYGGSLPIAGYLANAFRGLRHNTVLIDNSMAWDLYQTVTASVEHKTAANQLGQMLAHFLCEWTYARVVEFNPEICIVMAQAPVDVDFPERLAKHGIVSAFWYVENWRHLPYWREIAPRYDYFFHIQPGEFEEKLADIGCAHHAFVQTGCDPAAHRPVTLTPEEHAEYACDVSFAGAGYYNRLQLFKGLTDYEFKIWGVDWNDRELIKRVVGGERRFDSETFMKIVAGSKINLNLHSSTSFDGVDPKCDAINPRVFEIAAAGGFQLCDPCIGLDAHFDFETELPVYRNLKELRERIDYYLAHPEERREVAARARERTLRAHTYEVRAQQMLDLIFARHGARILRRGVRSQRTVGEMRDETGPDTDLGRYLSMLPPDLLFTQETLRPFLHPGRPEATYPERLFSYMAEVRELAESLLKDKR